MPVSIEKGAHVDSGTGAVEKDHEPKTHENPTSEVIWGAEGVEIHGRHTTESLDHEGGPTGAATSSVQRTYVQWPADVDHDHESSGASVTIEPEPKADEPEDEKVKPKAIKAREVEDKAVKASDAETA